MDTNPQGACMLYEQTWQCRVATGTTSTVTNCGGQQFCLDGRCFDTGYAPDADFARAVAGLEAQREAGRYRFGNTLEVFKATTAAARSSSVWVNWLQGRWHRRPLFPTFQLPITGAGGQAHRRHRLEPYLRRPLSRRMRDP